MLFAAFAAAAILAAPSKIECRQAADDTSGAKIGQLTLNYTLTTIGVFGDDQHATVAGDFVLDRGDRQDKGTLTGTLTPKIWYGGAFDLSLVLPEGTARLLEFRQERDIYLTIGETDTHLTCTGDVP